MASAQTQVFLNGAEIKKSPSNARTPPPPDPASSKCPEQLAYVGDKLSSQNENQPVHSQRSQRQRIPMTI